METIQERVQIIFETLYAKSRMANLKHLQQGIKLVNSTVREQARVQREGTQRQIQSIKQQMRATKEAGRFRMEWLSILFAGMAIQRMFSGAINASRRYTLATERMNRVMGKAVDQSAVMNEYLKFMEGLTEGVSGEFVALAHILGSAMQFFSQFLLLYFGLITMRTRSKLAALEERLAVLQASAAKQQETLSTVLNTGAIVENQFARIGLNNVMSQEVRTALNLYAATMADALAKAQNTTQTQQATIWDRLHLSGLIAKMKALVGNKQGTLMLSAATLSQTKATQAATAATAGYTAALAANTGAKTANATASVGATAAGATGGVGFLGGLGKFGKAGGILGIGALGLSLVGMSGAAGDASGALNDVATAMGIGSIVVTLAGSIGSLTGVLGGLTGALGAAGGAITGALGAMGPIGWAVLAIGALIAAIVAFKDELAGALEWLGTELYNVGVGVLELFMWIGKGVLEFLDGIKNAIADVFAKPKGEGGKEEEGGLGPLDKGPLAALIPAVGDFVDDAARKLGGFFDGIKTWFGQAGNDIGSFFNGIGIWAGKAWDTIASFFGGIGSWFGGVLGGAWNGIVSFFTGIGTWAGQAWTMIEGFFGGIGAWFGKVIDDAVKWVSGFFDGIGVWAKEAWSDIESFFGGIGTWFGEVFDGAKKEVDAFFGGIGKWAEEAWQKVESFFGGIGTWFNNVLNEAKGWVDGFFGGIQTWAGQAWAKIESTFSGIGSWFSGVLDSASNEISSFFRGIMNWADKAWKGIEDTFSGIGGWIGEQFEGIGGAIGDVVGDIGEGIGGGIDWLGEMLGFQEGGIVPRDTIAAVHKKEMVLPSNLAVGLTKILEAVNTGGLNSTTGRKVLMPAGFGAGGGATQNFNFNVNDPVIKQDYDYDRILDELERRWVARMSVTGGRY